MLMWHYFLATMFPETANWLTSADELVLSVHLSHNKLIHALGLFMSGLTPSSRLVMT